MTSSVDAALGRVALVTRAIGAVWMVVLATVYGVTGQIDRADVATSVTILGVVWSAVAWRRGAAGAVAGRQGLLAADLVVTALVVLVPAAVGETAGFSGGYPFAALVVGLAVGGRRGVIAAVGVLSVVTLVSLALVGSAISPFVVGQLLLYVFGGVALSLGADTFRAFEQRARRAEASLAVAEERAATATHLHDSVLQTLALVHRRAEEASTVRSLARRQERELRDWLFGAGAAVPDSSADVSAAVGGHTLGPTLERHGEDVEERHGVAVRVITVGGAAGLAVDADERRGLGALVLAAREAMTNAAEHAGVAAIDVFAEVEGDEVAVYVRDRGVGFDLAAVGADRQGLRGSILGRMERAGGRAEVRTAPGSGTEVRLRLAVDHDRSGTG